MSDMLSPLDLHPSQSLIAAEDAYKQLQEVIQDSHAAISVDFSVQQLSYLFQELSQAAIQLMKTHVSLRLKKMFTRSSLLTVDAELELVEQFLHQCLDYTQSQEAGVLALTVDLTAAHILNPPHSPVKSITKGRSLKLDIQTLIKFEGEPAIKRLEQKLTLPRAASPPFRYGIPPRDDEYYVKQPEPDSSRALAGGQQSTGQLQGVARDTLTEQQLEYYLLNLPRLRRHLLSAVIDRGELILVDALHPLLLAFGVEGKQVAATVTASAAEEAVHDIAKDEEGNKKPDKEEIVQQVEDEVLAEQKQQKALLICIYESSSKLCSEWINEPPLLPSDCSMYDFDANKIEKKLRVLERWNSKLRSAANDNVQRAKDTSQLLL